MRTHLALAFVLAACGGGSGGGLGTGPIEQAEAEELCRADCQRDIDCGEELDLESCTARCADDVVGWARADAVQTIFECTAALACGQTDDGCQRDVLPLPIHEEWEQRCLTELAECIPSEEIQVACSVSPIPGESDDVGFWRFITPAIMEEVIACLDETLCNSRVNCVQDVLEQHGVDF